ncbi:MAG: hypothetical protein GX359_05625 [Clostridiales bacterium]|nr:hypothetical protein [Clostridiales bacterium]
MNQAITIELQFFLISILWGAIILLGYDALRILRRLIKHKGFFLAVEDLIFWVVTSVFVFAMIYRENNGVIRGFSIMGMAIGMVLYHYILSDFIVNLITKIIVTLLTPFRFVLSKIKQLLKFLIVRAKKINRFLIIRLKKTSKSFKIAINTKRQKRADKRKKRRDENALKKNKKAKNKKKKKSKNKRLVEQEGNNEQKPKENRKRVKLEKV